MVLTKIMKVAVIGAGVNGICSAICLAQNGCKVTVYESNTPFGETSSKSSKLLHGGIRYLESFHIKLVREALQDRAWWIMNAGQYTKVNRFYIPIFKNRSRSRLKLYTGVKFYEWLAGSNSLGKSKYHNREETLAHNPALLPDGLLGSVSYIDVQMDDISLSEWLLKKAESLGVDIQSNTRIQRIGEDGLITKENGETVKFKKIVNVCGPWARKIVDDSEVNSSYRLALIKGSHIYLNRTLANPLVIQVPEDGRVVFALPHREITLIGTTELNFQINDEIKCTDSEISYLVSAAGSILDKKIALNEVIDSYAGVRSIVSPKQNIQALSRTSREAAIETVGDLTNVYGGKWTSAMRLGMMVSDQILK